MKRRREETPFEKAVVIIVEIAIAAIAIGVTVLLDFAMGSILLLTVVGPTLFGFFRKEDSGRSSARFIMSDEASEKSGFSKSEGELVSYQEYAVPTDSAAAENTTADRYDKYKSSSNEMEDVFTKK